MRCNKHPNYKGLRPTKRDCKTCKALREKVLQVKKKSFDDFESLTTPGFRTSSFHILAEVSCIMLFGKLPPYFWRKSTKCSQKIKDHYQKKMSYLFNEKKRRPEDIKQLCSLLWLVWAKDLVKKNAENIRDQEIVEDIKEKENIDRAEINDAPIRERKANIWDVLD